MNCYRGTVVVWNVDQGDDVVEMEAEPVLSSSSGITICIYTYISWCINLGLTYLEFIFFYLNLYIERYKYSMQCFGSRSAPFSSRSHFFADLNLDLQFFLCFFLYFELFSTPFPFFEQNIIEYNLIKYLCSYFILWNSLPF